MRLNGVLPSQAQGQIYFHLYFTISRGIPRDLLGSSSRRTQEQPWNVIHTDLEIEKVTDRHSGLMELSQYDAMISLFTMNTRYETFISGTN